MTILYRITDMGSEAGPELEVTELITVRAKIQSH